MTAHRHHHCHPRNTIKSVIQARLSSSYFNFSARKSRLKRTASFLMITIISTNDNAHEAQEIEWGLAGMKSLEKKNDPKEERKKD